MAFLFTHAQLKIGKIQHFLQLRQYETLFCTTLVVVESLEEDSAGKFEAEYMSPKLKNYYGDSVTITITSIDATHVAGTFSGKYLSDDNKPVPLKITDGSFDLPFTKDKTDQKPSTKRCKIHYLKPG